MLFPAQGRGRPTLAVDSFDLEIAASEFLVIVGPSGCGKSTVLSMTGGLVQPTGRTPAASVIAFSTESLDARPW